MNEVCLVQQEPAPLARLSSVLADFPEWGRAFESTAGIGVAASAAEGLPGIGGRAGDQRTLYALFIFPELMEIDFCRFNRLFCSRLSKISGSDSSHIWAECGGNGRDHLGVSHRCGNRRRTG